MKKLFVSALLFLLTAAVATLGVLYGEQRRRTEAYAAEVEAYRLRIRTEAESAAHTLSDALTDLSGNLHKLTAAATSEQTARLLGEVRRLSDRAGGAFSALPFSHAEGKDISQFLTRTGDYAGTLIAAVQGGTPPSETDAAQFLAIDAQCAALLSALERAAQEDRLPTDAVAPETFTTASGTLSVPACPDLQYDGKYAESSETAAPRGLPAGTVSLARATEIAAKSFPRTAWESAGRCDGAIATFEFTGAAGESLSVTERGGKILTWMTQPTQSDSSVPTESERDALQSTAAAFLSEQGFGTMHPVCLCWYGGCAVLETAAVQDGVALLADTVTVLLDRATGEVIGFDARGYYTCHTPRDLPAPKLTEQDARDAVSLSLQTESVTLCLLPKCATREILCYECRGAVGARTFLVYINAQTGAEEEILECVQGEDGETRR